MGESYYKTHKARCDEWHRQYRRDNAARVQVWRCREAINRIYRYGLIGDALRAELLERLAELAAAQSAKGGAE